MGPHEIVAPLGAGGMGEVYRARDTRLGRDVAIKVLPADVSADPARLRRFEQEARAAAALNHSNILAVYDTGREGDRAYIVTELLEGQTLRELLHDETPGISRVIDLASQIADGLAAAHGRNIVHRDLKPDNIFITADARAKILDFGLAKTVEAEADAAVNPTRSATDPQMVLGTAGYMAPEQARALPVDHRTDIFSFGAVLYEMVSGRRAFGGDTSLDRMTAILREAPAPLASSPERPLPPALVRIVDRCLEKSPAARFQSTTDLAFALKSLSQGETIQAISSAGAASVGAGPRSIQSRLPWAIAALALIGAVLALLFRGTADPLSMATNFQIGIGPPPGEAFGTAPLSPFAALSPDGQRVAFVATREGKTPSGIWVYSLHDRTLRNMDVVGGQPFWSPDSRWVGFFHEGELKAVDVESRQVRPICDAALDNSGFGGASWSSGVIIFAGGRSGPGVILQVPEDGGQPVAVTKLDTGAEQMAHRQPFFLPDGRRFLYQSYPDRAIWVGSLDGGPPRFLLKADSKAQYAPPGWLLYVLDGVLQAQRFDAGRLTFVESKPRAVVRDVRTNPANGRSAFSVSQNGALLYRPDNEDVQEKLVRMDASGKEIATVPAEPERYDQLEFLDDHYLLAAIRGGSVNEVDLWKIHLETGRRVRLTSEPGVDRQPVVSPDRNSLAYFSTRVDPGRIFKRPLNTAGTDQVWAEAQCRGHAVPTHWSMNWLIYMCGARGANDLWAMPTDGAGDPRAYLETSYDEAFGRLSPDQEWIVYQSNESPGGMAVYYRPFPDRGQPHPVSGPDGGTSPSWKSDGSQIVYRTASTGAVRAVPVKRTQNGLELGPERELPWRAGKGSGPIAIAPDLRGAIVTKPIGPVPPETPLVVYSNWLKLLGGK